MLSDNWNHNDWNTCRIFRIIGYDKYLEPKGCGQAEEKVFVKLWVHWKKFTKLRNIKG
jgi:hypothetical protein